ncbi:(p)ppGpp synthetase [Sulfurifustis variabilis]|uniref:GTP pyrophosphokinase n=1 Tax=Sulfurifustis variabilis TaxID=1675686 RepID=A0A1B4VAX1_9GAMM|nr:GTP diphosphokinase [Sulfurifustis variabilis]BAU49034.1 (p)ppGpp synthetase [Sulfurifustis variabilis]
MVSVTRPFAGSPIDRAADVEAWLATLAAGRPEAEIEVIRRACRFAEGAHAGQTRVSGEPFFTHALAAAGILAELKLDHETIAAAILHDVVEDTPATLEDVAREFGPRIAALVDGVTKMDVIQEYRGTETRSRREHAQAESLRKMLLAMAEDVRVVLIKLADRLHNMRTLGSLSEESRVRIARETMDVFAPLANRLGIWQLRWELEDLSFRYLEPAAYKQIAQMVAEKRSDRERYISGFVDRLSRELVAAGIQAEVTGRPKHIYGIWRKMRRKAKTFEQITDVRAVRVLVNTVRDCYAALGIVHSLWNHIRGEFDDYIATPKENNYRSIHTAVIGPEGKTVEVQIRTHEMHQQSELGVAAHWRYKEGLRPDESFDKKIAWLRTLLEWKDEVAEAADFVDQFKSEVFSERVYVFTPKGKVIDLPAGATPLDFAYAIHSDVGHRCRGAKVNGHIVPLTYALKTGEQVEVLTVKEGGPSRDWLNPHLGYLRTSKARSKVSQWFRLQNYEVSVADGRNVLEREFQRLGLDDVNYERLAHKSGFAKVDDFLAAIGRGDVKPSQIVSGLQEIVELRPKEERPLPAVAPVRAAPPAGVTILGVGNLLTRMGRCCNPVPGDPIVGFITRGHGITIHRRDCPNALRHHGETDERLIEVSWGAEAGRTYPVDIEITAYERAGLLRDITALLANERVNVLAVNTLTDKGQHVARMTFTVEVPDLGALARVLALIDQIPNVAEVHRKIQ